MAGDYETKPGRAGAVREGLRRVRRNEYLGLVVNAAPSALWLTVFFMIPLGVMFYYSFGERGAFGEVLLGPAQLGLQQYTTFFVPDGATIPQAVWYSLAWMIEGVLPSGVELATTDPTPYVKLTVKSINFAVVTTAVAFLLGYPLAYFLARNVSSERQNLLIASKVWRAGSRRPRPGDDPGTMRKLECSGDPPVGGSPAVWSSWSCSRC